MPTIEKYPLNKFYLHLFMERMKIMGFFLKRANCGWQHSEARPELHQRIGQTDVGAKLYVALYGPLY